MGYTPVFDTVFGGTLCGKYPDTAAWLFMLALADWRGHVDFTPEYIATVTGMPVDELIGCLERFMEPDPRSRSKDNEGRRLVLIDEDRDWGWKIVNFVKYRERAREMGRTERGENAEKQRRYRERKREKEALPGVTRNTPTHTQTNTNTKTREKKKKRATRLPTDWKPDDSVIEGLELKYPDTNVSEELERFTEYWTANGETKADWTAAFRYWVRRSREFRKGSGGKSKFDAWMERLDGVTEN